MMLTKRPPHTPMSDILAFIESKSARHGKRDRCLYVVRQKLRLSDISNLSVSSVVNLDGSIRRFVTGTDGKRFDLDATTQAELQRYIQNRFALKSLEDLKPEQSALPLFPTQKKPHFSPNTIAQHLSYIDRAVTDCFVAPQMPLGRASDTITTNPSLAPKKSPLTRLMATLAGAA